MSESRPSVSRSLADSPLFWLGLFALTALVALLAIGPKFARRQERLDRQHEAREEARRRGPDAQPANDDRPEGAPGATDDEGEPGGPIDRLAALVPLVLLLLVLGGIAWIALVWRRPGRR